MTFTYPDSTKRELSKRDVSIILKRLEEELVCHYPQTPVCDMCEEQPACEFIAALWRQLRKEVDTK